MQGKTALKDLDIVAEAGGPRTALVHEIRDIPLNVFSLLIIDDGRQSERNIALRLVFRVPPVAHVVLPSQPGKQPSAEGVG